MTLDRFQFVAGVLTALVAGSVELLSLIQDWARWYAVCLNLRW